MKKFILVLAVILLSCFGTITYAQHSKNVTAQDAVAAIAKGHISKPRPPILRFAETDPLLSSFPPEIIDNLVWYKYKGVFYSAYYEATDILIVVFAPNGEYANATPRESFFVIPI